jgi:hypothetical protein
MRTVTNWASIIAAGMIGGAAAPHRVTAQDSGFVAWPRELASRAPGLADGIAREFGQRPSTIAFGGRDTMRIVFWNPRIWQDDMESKVLPQKTLPLIAAAVTDVAAYVWQAIARDAGVSVIDVDFVRVVHDAQYVLPGHEVPAQVVSGLVTREMIETGRRAAVSVVQREAGAWDDKAQKEIDSLRWGPETQRATRAALETTVQRALHEIGVYVTLNGADTIDVEVSNPVFWRMGDTVKALPMATLPMVREAAKRSAETVWERHGRNAGTKVIRVTFHREWRELKGRVAMQRAAQDVRVLFTRRQMAAGLLEPVQLTIVER